MSPLLQALVAAAAMEPVAAVLHRLVMHGPGWGWHRSHHQARSGRLERNDLYPLVLALATAGAMGLGSAVVSLRALLHVGIGVTAYGLAYLVVHDLCIHQRLGRLSLRVRYLGWVTEAHRVHHLFGAAPYGFLCPLVPGRLRARAAGITRDPLARGSARELGSPRPTMAAGDPPS